MATFMLILCRQSKLSPQQLDELQKSTHFDKKELQQWYKGRPNAIPSDRPPPLSLPCGRASDKLCPHRIPQGLSYRHPNQRRVPKDLSAVLPLWRPEFLRRLCI